jgi:hypothetical protein
MGWYNYLAIFFSGAFFANAVPHFVSGVSGDKFPSPFAKPPGKGLSPPTLNVLWAGLNLIIGYVLFAAGKTHLRDCTDAVVFFVGAMVMSVMLSSNFKTKHKE